MVMKVECEYVNARIRAMKSRLLPPSTIESLVLKPDVEGIITELGNTAYREELEKASVQFSGIMCVEVALRWDFTGAFRRILRFMRGDESEKYIRILIGRWDVQNIKTILRGKNIHVPAAEIHECLVPAGELDETTMIELVKQPDIKAVIDLMATWAIGYAKPLTQNFQEFTEKRDLAVLEYAIDRYYFHHALRAVKGEHYDDCLMREMLMTEIDVTNIKNVLRLIRDNIEAEEAAGFIIEGGTVLTPAKLLSMVKTGTLMGAIKALDETPYRFLTDTPEEVFRMQKISVFEKELEKYLIRQGVRRFLSDPLSIAIPIAYLWAKYNEVTNIRIIARCKTGEVPEKELRGELVYV